jgi:hypothetical protein
MTEPNGGSPLWYRSSYSNGAGGECVECAFTDDGMLVRDSKTAAAGVITMGSTAWCAFAQGVKYFAAASV